MFDRHVPCMQSSPYKANHILPRADSTAAITTQEVVQWAVGLPLPRPSSSAPWTHLSWRWLKTGQCHPSTSGNAFFLQFLLWQASNQPDSLKLVLPPATHCLSNIPCREITRKDRTEDQKWKENSNKPMSIQHSRGFSPTYYSYHSANTEVTSSTLTLYQEALCPAPKQGLYMIRAPGGLNECHVNELSSKCHPSLEMENKISLKDSNSKTSVLQNMLPALETPLLLVLFCQQRS